MENSTDNILVVNPNNIKEVLAQPKPVLIYFWHPQCPCNPEMMPIVKQIAQAYQGRVVVGTVNHVDYPDLQQEYGVYILPGLAFFYDGQQRYSLIGLQPCPCTKAQIAAQLEVLVEACAA